MSTESNLVEFSPEVTEFLASNPEFRSRSGMRDAHVAIYAARTGRTEVLDNLFQEIYDIIDDDGYYYSPGHDEEYMKTLVRLYELALKFPF